MTQLPDDKILITRLKEGDILSFDSLFNKYNKKVYYFAFSYLKNREEAEDIVQDVFLNLWKCREQINEYYIFSKYLFKITFNEVLKKFRKQASDKNHLVESMKDFALADSSTDFDIEYNNLIGIFNSLIEKMPARQKEIFLLSMNNHLGNEQIAEKLNISRKTVENYITIAKTSLKKSLISGMLSFAFAIFFIS
jgi:RNA polymerase sigma-70 factor (family 1)